MPQPISIKLRPALATALALTLASLILAACGSSSNSSTTTSTSASATTPGGAAPSTGGRSGRFTAVRECLQKDGITLPKRTPGKSPGGTPGGFGGIAGGGAAPTLPKGVTRAQYEADLKKCGGLGTGRFPGATSRLTSPVFKAALAKFATCMRQNGENVPAPNTSGKGPIFSTKGLNTASAQFKSAQVKCSTVLRAGFRGSPGGGGGPGATPPSAG